jgi:hypothetical protein
MLSDVSLLAVSKVNNPVGLVSLPYVMWSAHFFVTHIQTEKISSWNGPTVHVCCFMLARASSKTFVSRVRKTAKKSSLAGKFVSSVTHYPRYHCIPSCKGSPFSLSRRLCGSYTQSRHLGNIVPHDLTRIEPCTVLPIA